MKDDKLYLIYITECLDRIKDYTAGGREAFSQSKLIQDGVLRNLHTMSESTQRISDRLKASYPEVPWSDIAKFRNVLVHDYLEIDLKRIWDIVENDLPPLKRQVEAILQDLGGP
ncbi:MAG: DUF86 domain-containing protein [Thermodesulfobacteriota bacterium]